MVYYTLGGVLKEITFVCDKVEEIFKIVPKAWVWGGGNSGEKMFGSKKSVYSIFLRHALKPGCETRACKQFAFFSYWPKKVWKSRRRWKLMNSHLPQKNIAYRQKKNGKKWKTKSEKLRFFFVNKSKHDFFPTEVY